MIWHKGAIFTSSKIFKGVKDITFDDNISHILNKEIIMIPSSPLITYDTQKYISKVIANFINNIDIIEISNQNIDLLSDFLKNDIPSTFRYFNSRDKSIINNHIKTLLILDNNIPFGYAHIDYSPIDNKYWFGICILENYQNKGYGNLLINHILNLDEVKILDSIYLSVDKININAINLYQKNGFKIIDFIDNPNIIMMILSK